MSSASLPHYVGTDKVASAIGDIRFHTNAADYDGFYRMNGRAAGALPPDGAAGLAALGLAAIPNAAGRKMRMGGALGTVGGANTATLARANMPNANITGNTPSGGAHNHSLNNATNVRNAANLNPRTVNGNIAGQNTGAITANASNNPHNHTIAAATGGGGVAFPLGRATVAVRYFMCLDNAVLNTWRPLLGDVKNSFQPADHDGWVLMDGRALVLLTATQQATAAVLGMVGDLPNATGAALKMRGPVLAVGGSDTQVLTRANLPAVNVTANSSTSPNTHNHSLNNATIISGLQAPSFNHTKNGGITMPQRTISMAAGGAHTHAYTLAIGGASQAFSIVTPYITANAFVYLGA